MPPEKTSQNFKKGDLVRIKRYHKQLSAYPSYKAADAPYYYTTGIVVSDIVKERDYQSLIFPYVKVYLFDIREVRVYGPSALEGIEDEE